MYKHLTKYLSLINECIDPDAQFFYNSFKPQVEKIKTSRYNDKLTKLRITVDNNR